MTSTMVTALTMPREVVCVVVAIQAMAKNVAIVFKLEYHCKVVFPVGLRPVGNDILVISDEMIL
jgi:hypothetical protein